jgi:hypothetical protein
MAWAAVAEVACRVVAARGWHPEFIRGFIRGFISGFIGARFISPVFIADRRAGEGAGS